MRRLKRRFAGEGAFVKSRIVLARRSVRAATVRLKRRRVLVDEWPINLLFVVVDEHITEKGSLLRDGDTLCATIIAPARICKERLWIA